MALQRRLLHDIAELRKDPYPNITLHPTDDLREACLVLTPPEKDPLHLIIEFGSNYPLHAPHISIQSRVSHPNVFGDYICASILNTDEGYTPAYTLKGICIQLLSFFSSDRIEQEGGRYSIELSNYKREESSCASNSHFNRCSLCGFRSGETTDKDRVETAATPYRQSLPRITVRLPPTKAKVPELENLEASSISLNSGSHGSNEDAMEIDTISGAHIHNKEMSQTPLIDHILQLPNEVIMLILEELDTATLMTAAKISHGIGELVRSSDFIRLRELQCFCLKESFLKLQLGIGISVTFRGRQGTLGSEFDLLSLNAFRYHRVRRSIQGLPFAHWLPLPLSRRHWRSVYPLAESSLHKLAHETKLRGPDSGVIHAFMTDIVVKLSQDFESRWKGSIQSTLRHASEKAIESYFSLFHLLLCLAVAQPNIVKEANDRVWKFEHGWTSKEDCPNLGHLLTLTLVTDQGLTPSLSRAIIREAVIRNVVWMLDPKGANMPELSYLEPTPNSGYRLQRTFEASRTSYRILMFQTLFAKIARPTNTPISTICDEIFDRHGAPPPGTAEALASDIRHLRSINSFQDFFSVIGVDYEPNSFPNFLKDSITMSVEKRYSRWPFGQDKALGLRLSKEPDVERAEGVMPDNAYARGPPIGLSFFPGNGRRR